MAVLVYPKPKIPVPPKRKAYRIEVRWTPELVADGFTAISVFFLENYSSLSPPITHSEAMLIVHLMRYKWSEDAPYPGFKTIARQMGISPQMARHHARSLSQKNYLTRELQKGATNKFHLKPLFDALGRLRAKKVPTPPVLAPDTPTTVEIVAVPPVASKPTPEIRLPKPKSRPNPRRKSNPRAKRPFRRTA